MLPRSLHLDEGTGAAAGEAAATVAGTATEGSSERPTVAADTAATVVVL